MPPKVKYTDKQVEQLLRGIHEGSITQHELPEDLYFAIADYLKRGLYEGFGSDLDTVTETQEELLTDLRENVYLFSAAKTYQFTGAAADQLLDEDGVIKPFDQFYKDGVEVYGEYNEDWASAEYRTTIGQAQMAQRWEDIQDNKDVLPMLRFSTDGQPCPECEPFEDLTAPVDDPIWDIALPLLHYNCECIIISEDDTVVPTSAEDLEALQPNLDAIQPAFRNNPGNSGEIFPKGHPYFSEVPAADKAFAKRNFDLPIPENDGE